MKSHIIAVPLLCAVVFAAGCRPTTVPVRAWTSPTLRQEGIRRVVLVPFHSDAPGNVSELVTSATGLELQKTGAFDIVTPPAEDMADLMDEARSWESGVIRPANLVRAQKRFRADAFVFGAVTRCFPYEPPVLGLKVQMIAAKTGQAVWVADGIFDANERDVYRLVQDHYRRTYRKKEGLMGWRQTMISMRRYSEFCTYHMVKTMGYGTEPDPLDELMLRLER